MRWLGLILALPLALGLLFLGCAQDGSLFGVCGDGVENDLEECDDGNLNDGDGCNADCEIAPIDPPGGCGDGTVDPGEECDDGNQVDGDGCAADCTNEVTLDAIQTTIFGPRCAECHFPGGTGPMPMHNADASFDSLVGQNSFLSNLLRVEPFEPELSFLIHKIDGRPGILGQQMPPPPRVPLSPEEIQEITDWILAGAPR
jgi:cysteine-rich repeat protein